MKNMDARLPLVWKGIKMRRVICLIALVGILAAIAGCETWQPYHTPKASQLYWVWERRGNEALYTDIPKMMAVYEIDDMWSRPSNYEYDK